MKSIIGNQLVVTYKYNTLDLSLLEVCNYNCDYREAQTIFVKSQQLLSQYRQNINDDTQLNLPIIFIQYALLHFNLGSYDMALTWAIDALRHIVADRTPVKVYSYILSES